MTSSPSWHLALGVTGTYIPCMARTCPHWRLRAPSLAAALLAVLPACAGPDGGQPPGGGGLTWAGYLYGEDLRVACREGEGDRYRLIFNAGQPGQTVHVLELTGSSAAGGVMKVWTLPVSDVGQLRPAEPALAVQGAPAKTAGLSPEQFRVAAHGLAYGGKFLPPYAQLDLKASRLRWFATGCFDGFYFFSAYTQPGTLRVGFIPQP